MGKRKAFNEAMARYSEVWEARTGQRAIYANQCIQCPKCGSGRLKPRGEQLKCRKCKSIFVEADAGKYFVAEAGGMMINAPKVRPSLVSRKQRARLRRKPTRLRGTKRPH